MVGGGLVVVLRPCFVFLWSCCLSLPHKLPCRPLSHTTFLPLSSSVLKLKKNPSFCPSLFFSGFSYLRLLGNFTHEPEAGDVVVLGGGLHADEVEALQTRLAHLERLRFNALVVRQLRRQVPRREPHLS